MVARDVSKVVEIGGELGLSLNMSECELISHDDFTVTDSLLQSFPRACIGDVTLLGAPLFPGPSLDRAWSDRCAEFEIVQKTKGQKRLYRIMESLCKTTADQLDLLVVDQPVTKHEMGHKTRLMIDCRPSDRKHRFLSLLSPSSSSLFLQLTERNCVHHRKMHYS